MVMMNDDDDGGGGDDDDDGGDGGDDDDDDNKHNAQEYFKKKLLSNPPLQCSLLRIDVYLQVLHTHTHTHTHTHIHTHAPTSPRTPAAPCHACCQTGVHNLQAESQSTQSPHYADRRKRSTDAWRVLHTDQATMDPTLVPR